MKALFADVPEAIKNTEELAAKIEPVKLRSDEIHLPHFGLPEGFDSENEYLKHLTIEGAKKRYGELSDEVMVRILHVLDIIAVIGCVGYFVIVLDFMLSA